MPLIVNGERIEDAFIEQEFANIKSQFEAASGNACCCDRDDEFRGYARDNMTARVLLTQAARTRIERLPEAEIDAALQKIKDEHGGEAQFHAATGTTPDDESLIRDDLEINLRVQKFIDSLCADAPAPTDESLRAFYNEHLDLFMNPEKIRASHILKNAPRAENRQAVYDQLRSIREQALDGADFAVLAKEHSDKATEAQQAAAEGHNTDGDDGIDLGFFQRGTLMDEFETVAFSLRVGEVSPIFTTPYGYHLIHLVDRVAAAPKPFDEVRDKVRRQYLEERRNDKILDAVEDLKTQATIEQVDPEPD
jgi:parvulin-like peptidyl-prolyl isomerase